MNLFIGIGLSLIFIVEICIFFAILAFVERMRKLEPKIDIIEAWVVTASPNRHSGYSIGGRPMTKAEKEEGIGSVEPIPRNKPDVPS